MSYKLGEYLRTLRGNRSLREISKLTNGEVSHSYINDLEKGVSRRGNVIKPSPDKLMELSKVYGVQYHELMDLAGYPSDSSSLTNIKPFSKNDMINIPVVGVIKAGPDGLAMQDYQGSEFAMKDDLDSSFEYFWLIVTGDSMVGDGINDGDYALIKKTTEFNNGDICAVIVDGEEGTLKHVTKEPTSIVLTASNPKYQPRIFIGKDMNEIMIAGKLERTMRKY
ncbi:helix-turn-helix domain-containing protein [Pediococcus stilesii]|uniref:Helix-turn-helix domain-containing protein n=1 Tax=Pediococcus stilesii TaxID=331679 RepID=A0A5R9BXH9_9LACO|nr:LexA family transcriptional regulator [Pediococcus stilesii]TLQ05438.1 helix-turn-helix domain-containing protein [Pediococcus stilesii]